MLKTFVTAAVIASLSALAGCQTSAPAPTASTVNHPASPDAANPTINADGTVTRLRTNR